MSMRQAVVRVIAAVATKTLNHKGHEGPRSKAHTPGVRGFPLLRTERARTGQPQFCLIPTRSVPSLRRRSILAWHLRNRARGKAFKEPARFHGIVLLVGREHDQE